MTQYCRYCCFMVCGDANYCTMKQKCYSEAHIKHSNTCKHSILNPMDALQENAQDYQPRQKKRRKPLEYYDGFDFSL